MQRRRGDFVRKWVDPAACTRGRLFGTFTERNTPPRAPSSWPYLGSCARSVAFQVCEAVARSWEDGFARDDVAVDDVGGASGLDPHGVGLASTLVVFDTLAEACFVSFEDGNTTTLATALGAIWAADVAFRRAAQGSTGVSARGPIGRRPHEEGNGGVSVPGEETASASVTPGMGGGGGGKRAPPVREDAGVVAEATDHQGEVGRECGEGSGRALGSADGGEGQPAGDTTKWVEDSRMMHVVRSLAQRCRGLPRAEGVGGGDGGGSGGGGGGGSSSTGGVDASTVSEVGSIDLPSAPSVLELAEAVMDGVGPEATGDVLASCSQLLENIPPKVRAC